MDEVLRKIKAAMEDMLQKDTRCNYEIHCNGSVVDVRASASEAYMLTWKTGKENNADAYCYMCPDGKRAAGSVFNVVNGVVTLSGQRII